MPTLDEVDSLLFALGLDVSKQPRSIPAHSVYARLQRIVPGFGKAERELCEYLSILRNEELHTGGLPFETLKEVDWIGRYYAVCELLCNFLGRELSDYLGDDKAKSAGLLIQATTENIKKSVLDTIADRRRWFEQQTQEKQQELSARAELITKVSPAENSTARNCPACARPGILQGTLIMEHAPRYDDGQLLVNQELLATTFSCSSCELDLSTLGEIVHAGIEPRFAKDRTTSLHEMFEEELIDGYMNM